jgi:hypothetical protein
MSIACQFETIIGFHDNTWGYPARLLNEQRVSVLHLESQIYAGNNCCGGASDDVAVKRWSGALRLVSTWSTLKLDVGSVTEEDAGSTGIICVSVLGDTKKATEH